MVIDVSRVADVVMLRLCGDIKQRKDLTPVLLSFIRKGDKKFILCFSQVYAINSIGFQSLIEFQSMLESKGGGMRLCNMRKEIKRCFGMSKIDEVIRIVDDEDAALMDLLAGLHVTADSTAVSRHRN